MLQIRNFKVCIKITDNGKECTNPTIVLGKNKDLLKNCEIDKDGCISFSVLEDEYSTLQGKCIPYTIICQDCGDCPVKDGEICFCDNNNDCDNCSNCIGGICKPKCPDKCVDGNCVDCTGEDCPTNQKCINGKCQCPADKPYLGEDGVCRECRNSGDCKSCEDCKQGDCVPKDCGEGECDPRINDCVQCVTNDKCGENECCKNNKCECCPGFVYNPVTKKCEPAPDCIDNEDCGECKNCIKGKCAPIICPEGFKCSGGDCVPNPCNDDPCKDGTDCGKQCGCKDKICTECAKLSCQDCDKALGCKCNPQTGKCEKVTDCDNPCVTKHDCGNNCGCDDATCKDCANYSCEECGKIPGCKCNPQTNKCEGDGTRGDDNCKDTFKVEKGPVCEDPKLIATLTKDTPCNCEPFNFEVKDFASGGKLLIKKVKGDGLVSFSDTLSPFISDKEKEVEGTVKVVIKGSYNTTDDLGTNIAFEQSITLPVNDTSGEINLKNFIPLQATNFNKLTAASITITNESLKVKENNCSYGKEVLYTNSVLTNFNYSNGTVIFTPSATEKSDTKIASPTKRQPLFIWYEDLNNIVKREYVNGTTTFVSELKPDLYKTKKSYKVTNDCSCKKDALYIWDCEKEKYFEKVDIVYELLDCGKTFHLKNVIGPCNPLHKKEDYELFVNGEIVFNITKDAIPLGGIKKSYANPIESIYIKVKGTECRKDYEVEKQDDLKPDIITECNPTTGKTLFKISNKAQNSDVTIKSILWGIDSATNVLNALNGIYTLESDVPLIIVVEFSNGCKQAQFSLQPLLSCCDACFIDVTDYKVFFDKAGDTSSFKINHNCKVTDTVITGYNGVTVGTVNNESTITYTTPNNNITSSVKFIYGSCEQTILIDFEKNSLVLELEAEAGCSNPKLTVKSTNQGLSNIAFEVKSSCTNNIVWAGIYTGVSLSNTIDQAITSCDYYLHSVGGITLLNPTKVTYTKKQATPIYSVSQNNNFTIIDNCEINGVQLIVGPLSYDFKGTKVTYLIGSAQYTATVGDDNTILIPSANLNCNGSNTILIKTLQEFNCPPVNRDIEILPINIPCPLNVTTTFECITDVPYIQFSGIPTGASNVQIKVGINTYNVIKVGSDFTYGRYDSQDARLVNSNYTLIVPGYCPIELSKPVLKDCSKTVLKMSGPLSACINGNIMTFINKSIQFTNFLPGQTLSTVLPNLQIFLQKTVNGVNSTLPLTNLDYTVSGNTLTLNNNTGFYQVGGAYSLAVNYTNPTGPYNNFVENNPISISINQNQISGSSPALYVLVKNIGFGWEYATDIITSQPFSVEGNTTITVPSSFNSGSLKLLPVILNGSDNINIYETSVNGGLFVPISSVLNNQLNWSATGSSVSTLQDTTVQIRRNSGGCISNTVTILFDKEETLGYAYPVFQDCNNSENTFYIDAGNTWQPSFNDQGKSFLFNIVSLRCYSFIGYFADVSLIGNLDSIAPLNSFDNCEDCNNFIEPPIPDCGPCGTYDQGLQTCISLGDGGCPGLGNNCQPCTNLSSINFGKFYCAFDVDYCNNNQ